MPDKTIISTHSYGTNLDVELLDGLHGVDVARGGDSNNVCVLIEDLERQRTVILAFSISIWYRMRINHHH